MHDHKKVFIVGCPRSGTTWMQLLLEQHPKIASGPETQIFEWYVRPLLQAWDYNERTYSDMGLFKILSESAFDDLLRNFVEQCLEKFRANKPNAQVVLEKTPWHLMHHDVMLRLFPDALILHIIRDPRSVAASLKAVSTTTWGQGWASGNAGASTQLWLRAMNRRSIVAAATPNYREVRYEDLIEDTPKTLGDLFAWIGMDASPAFCAQAAANCGIERLRKGETAGLAERITLTIPNRDQFYRRGQVNSWQHELTPREIKTVEYLAAETMRELGYEPALDPVRMPLSLWFTQTKRHARHRLAPYASAIANRLSK